MSAGDGQGHGALLCPHHRICSSRQHLCTSHHQFVPGDHTSTTFTSRVHQADPSAAQNPLKHPKPKPPPHFCILILLLLQLSLPFPAVPAPGAGSGPGHGPGLCPAAAPLGFSCSASKAAPGPPAAAPLCRTETKIFTSCCPPGAETSLGNSNEKLKIKGQKEIDAGLAPEVRALKIAVM